jgi:hypothetical protein
MGLCFYCGICYFRFCYALTRSRALGAAHDGGPFVVEASEDRAVDQRTFNVVASVIFALVALLHLLRIYMGWPIVIGSWTAPMWVSWIGLVVGGGLSYFGLSLASRS